MHLTAQTLDGPFARLEPISEAHRDALRLAADDAATWRHFPDRGDGAYFDALFDRRLTQHRDGLWHVYSVRDIASGALVGQTCLLNIDTHSARVEIGGTWYRADARGGRINPQCKYLLMQAVFTTGARRVELKTDARNLRSRAAILKLGATEEGILRRHTLMWDGHVRDTVYFSVLDHEWAQVRSGLLDRLR